MAVKRNEQLVLDFPPLAAQLEGGQWIVSGSDSRLLQYFPVTPTGTAITAWYLERQIDLGGFFVDEDTVLIPQMYLTQDPGLYAAISATDYASGRGLMAVTEIISTRKLDMQVVVDDISLLSTYPGMPLSIYDKQQIVVGEGRDLMPNIPAYDPNTLAIVNQPGISVLNRQSSFGYTEAIANQTLYAYRIIIPALEGEGDRLLVPSLRMRLEVGVDSVSSREFIYTLKRNVELDQS